MKDKIFTNVLSSIFVLILGKTLNIIPFNYYLNEIIIFKFHVFRFVNLSNRVTRALIHIK